MALARRPLLQWATLPAFGLIAGRAEAQRVRRDPPARDFAPMAKFFGDLRALERRQRRGPVTVLVLRGEAVKRRVPFDEAGYRGVLLPVPGGGGGIAVLARSGAGGAPDVEATAAQVQQAIAWEEK